jgi:predicted lipid-binding transport protein (Tim44 family)
MHQRDLRRVHVQVLRTKSRLAALVLAAALVLTAGVAEARLGMGGSFGSRGLRTWSAPPITRTAPYAAPIDRSITQPGIGGYGRTGVPFGRPGFFGGTGFMGGLLGGLLGAGLFGSLFGYGFFGGIGGFGSIFGLLLQFGIIFLLIRWAFARFGGARRPAYAGPAGWRGEAEGISERSYAGQGTDAPTRSSGERRQNDEIGLAAADFDAFEDLLGAVQTAYGREDLGALRQKLTPEMQSEISEELARNAGRGVVNRVSDVKLLQGDLAEAWREGDSDYATVAMRYAVRDVTEDRATGKVVDTGPSEVTELWTFRRIGGGRWLLSAVQQA